MGNSFASSPSLSDIFPIGMVVPFAGSSEPDSWLLCDGRSLVAASYSRLFNIIGYTYGGSGANFNLPDLRGDFIRGADDMGSAEGSRAIDGGRVAGSTQDDATEVNGLSAPAHTHTYVHGHSIAHNHGAFNSDPGGQHEHLFLASAGASTIKGLSEAGCNSVCGASYSGTTPTLTTLPGGQDIMSLAANHQHLVDVPNYTGNTSSQSETVSSGASSTTIASTDSETRPRNIALNYIIKA